MIEIKTAKSICNIAVEGDYADLAKELVVTLKALTNAANKADNKVLKKAYFTAIRQIAEDGEFNDLKVADKIRNNNSLRS